MSNEKRANAAVIIPKGTNIDEWIAVLVDKILIEAGWCKVFHHSTEYLVIGTLIIPKIVIIDVTLNTLSLFSQILQATAKSTEDMSNRGTLVPWETIPFGAD